MELIKCFKALSDKTRLRLLHVLHRYELNVNEIVLVVEMIQSGVSRHLKILVESGLLTSRREASYIYYSTARNDVVKSLISLVDLSFEKEETGLKDLEKAREMIKIRQNRTKRFFKTVAPRWDRLKKEVLGNFDLNAEIEKKISFTGKTADLGCGTGELIENLSSRTQFQIIGIDSSPEMLEQSRLRLSGIENVQLRLGELEHLPMQNREIDTAVMNMVLHHIVRPEQTIAEAFRVLKPGGRFILSDFAKHDMEKVKDILGGLWLGFERSRISTWLNDAGFCILGVDSYCVDHGLTINMFTAQKPVKNGKEVV